MNQSPITITIQNKWGSPGFDALISNRKTAYAISFAENGELRLHACKIVDGEVQFAHNPSRGIAINLRKSTYDVWGLYPTNMKTIYQMLIPVTKESSEILQLREELADLEHEQWSHWTKYFLGCLSVDKIPYWNALIKTPYKDLTEDQKDSDRVWADKVLEILLKPGGLHEVP